MESITEIVNTEIGLNVHVERHVEGHGREVVILVNGALSTMESFRQTVKYLAPNFDVVLYDLPYYGKSSVHNPGGDLLSSADEVRILRGLIDRYQVDHIASISWGGVATLLALCERPASIRTATIASFSPLINPAMRAYITAAQQHLEAGNYSDAATLLNDTVGRYLPRLLRMYNHRYISNLTPSQYRQTIFHIRQMRSLPVQEYLERMRRIDVPVLFINGGLDDYTTTEDIRSMATYVAGARFETVPEAGHFLELEGKRNWERMRHVVTAFMQQAVTSAEASHVPAHGGMGPALLPDQDLVAPCRY
jgi:rhamnosyltransferase subunit A